VVGNWIDGGWRAAGDETFDAVNPATGETLTPHFAEATADEVDAAALAARHALSAVREHDPLWPAELLDAIASQIEGLGDELLVRGEAETALATPAAHRGAGTYLRSASHVRWDRSRRAVGRSRHRSRRSKSSAAAEARSPSNACSARPRCCFWREQFSVRVRRVRRRHGFGACRR